jgi:hypothetical protein
MAMPSSRASSLPFLGSDAHSFEDLGRDVDARNFVVQKFRVAEADSGQMPATIGMRTCSIFRGIPELLGIENGLRDRVFRAPASTFHSKRRISSSRLTAPGIDADADRKCRRFADRVVAEIEPVIELVDHIRQADRVDVENGGRVRIRAHLWRIAGDDQQIVQIREPPRRAGRTSSPEGCGRGSSSAARLRCRSRVRQNGGRLG